ncbi:MAG: FAD-linked oxidase C-terminal domain-containing protein, partial [Planctomycetota bacterium]
LLTFPSLEIAAEAVAPLRAAGVASCDLIDRRRLSLARELDPRFETLLPGAAEAVLSVEVFAETDAELAERTAAAVGAVRGEEPLAAEAIVAETTEQLDLFGQLSRRMVSAIHGLRGVRRAVPGIEDIALPPAALPQFFRRLQDTLKRRQVTATVCGHVGHGQLHFRPLLDLTKASDVRQLETLAAELYDTVWLLGGSMSGEHGDGLARTPFTSRQHGPLVNVFREVRSLLDPAGLLNPGKVTPVAGARMTHAMRRTSPGRTPALTAGEPTPSLSLSGEAPEKPIVELQLEWSLDEAGAASDACHGCGACRTTGDATRMCPIFRYTPREEASPRAKANLVRGVLSGDLPAETLLTDEAKEVADLCVNCHQCRLDCPAGVDIPGLMLEAKSAYVATNGLRWDAWWTARVDTLARMASGWPTVTNALLRSRLGRWALERTTGLAAGRKLPPIAGRPYLRQAASRRLNRPAAGPERLYYFVDTYANHFDTLLATALERIARRHGVGFYAPGDQQPSGMALLSQGALEEARRVASRNVARLAEAVRDGYAIVATEPSAVLAITHEYPRLLPEEEDARLVAASTYEACHYLWRRHQDARLQLDLAPLPITVAHHTPCHVRALGVDGVAENLLRLIPELRPVRVEKGC